MESERKTKAARCHPPDAIVVVGRGDNQKEFKCYKVILSISSEFFNNAFASSMNEGQTGRVVLEDQDPDEWKEVYKFIDPISFPNSTKELDSKMALRLLPFFDYLQMTDVIEMCDSVLAQKCKHNIHTGPLLGLIEIYQNRGLHRFGLHKTHGAYFRKFRFHLSSELDEFDGDDMCRAIQIYANNQVKEGFPELGLLEKVLSSGVKNEFELEHVRTIISLCGNSSDAHEVTNILLEWLKQLLPKYMHFDETMLRNDLLPIIVYGEIVKKRVGKTVRELPVEMYSSIRGAPSIRKNAANTLKTLMKNCLGGYLDVPDNW